MKSITINYIAITGANGFLGQNLIKYALTQDWRVKGIVRRPKAAKIVEKLGADPYIVKDFDIEELINIFKECKSVVHFANIVCGTEELFEKINVKGTENIIKAAEEAGINRFIYPSGLGTGVYNEYDWSSNEYFRSKFRAEDVIKNGKVPYIIFRPSYILGPGDELIPDIIDQIGEDLIIIAGEGKIPTQPIYVGDAVKAFLAAAKGEGEDNQIYYLVGPKIINMMVIIDLVIKNIRQLGFNISYPRIKHIPFKEAPEELDLCKEMIDVMKCDLIKDGNITAEKLKYELTPIEKAIREAVIDRMIIKKNDKKRALVLLSGGIDSATTLYWAKDQNYETFILSIDYYLRPSREKEASRHLAKETHSTIIEISLPFLKEAFDLRLEGYPSPCAINTPEGFIPFRNLIFYSIAAYFAEAYSCDIIIGGHLNSDSKKFLDATPAYFKSFESLINDNLQCSESKKIKIMLPLKNMKKSDVINLALQLNVPIKETWSCSSDGIEPCGECSSCIEFKKALERTGKNK